MPIGALLFLHKQQGYDNHGQSQRPRRALPLAFTAGKGDRRHPRRRRLLDADGEATPRRAARSGDLCQPQRALFNGRYGAASVPRLHLALAAGMRGMSFTTHSA